MNLSQAAKDYLNELYGNVSKAGSLGGIDSLYNAVKAEKKFNLSKKEIKTWLLSNETYTLHKGISSKFKRNKVIVGDINQQWDVDLADMSKFSKKNNGYKYFILAIDILSKFIRTKAIKSKNKVEVERAFKSILEQNKKAIPESIHTDRGTEFTNTTFQKLLKKYKINHFFTNNELKAMIAERGIKTIKLKLYKYFTESKTFKWVRVLQQITNTYNNTKSRSIGMKPNEVTKENQDIVWNKLYPLNRLSSPPKFKYKINDNVRVSFLKSAFRRAYDYYWSGEIFVITERFYKEYIPKYRIKDWNNESIEGTFYEEELQKVTVDNNTQYRIEKILRRRIRNGVREVKVKWFLWGDKFNSWIPENEITNYN